MVFIPDSSSIDWRAGAPKSATILDSGSSIPAPTSLEQYAVGGSDRSMQSILVTRPRLASNVTSRRGSKLDPLLYNQVRYRLRSAPGGNAGSFLGSVYKILPPDSPGCSLERSTGGS